ncbi:WXG100 family type VII secretion target [Streptosporangium sp. NPDC000396]|uniref:WXG100 family type VII secretion target n=1 Tax=Streptosporangium sp. NPDC000396 TaxID=3366185 RepID=UPI0036B5F2CA
MSVLAVATCLLVEGAQGNEEAIRRAKTSWINALGGTLGVEGQMMPGVETVRRAMTGWDADDQDAFEAALNIFNSQMGALKTSMEYMGEGLGHLADAYAEFDMSLRITGVSLITALVGLMVARRFPATAAAAVFGEAVAVRTANITVIALLGQLGAFVANAAMNLASLRSSLLNIKTVLPTGPGAINFPSAKINTTGLPPFQPPPEREPGEPRQLPPGSEDFDWNMPEPDR